MVAIGASTPTETDESSATYDPLFDVFSTTRQRFTVIDSDDMNAYGQESFNKSFDANSDESCLKALKGAIQKCIDDTRNPKVLDTSSRKSVAYSH